MYAGNSKVYNAQLEPFKDLILWVSLKFNVLCNDGAHQRIGRGGVRCHRGGSHHGSLSLGSSRRWSRMGLGDLSLAYNWRQAEGQGGVVLDYIPYWGYQCRISWWQSFDAALLTGIQLAFLDIFGLAGEEEKKQYGVNGEQEHNEAWIRYLALFLPQSHLVLVFRKRPFHPCFSEICCKFLAKCQHLQETL